MLRLPASTACSTFARSTLRSLPKRNRMEKLRDANLLHHEVNRRIDPLKPKTHRAISYDHKALARSYSAGRSGAMRDHAAKMASAHRGSPVQFMVGVTDMKRSTLHGGILEHQTR